MRYVLFLVLALVGGYAGLYAAGQLPDAIERQTTAAIIAAQHAVGIGGAAQTPGTPTAEAPKTAAADVAAPAVGVIAAQERAFAERVLVTGTIVPREEVLVAPQVEGLRVLTVEADAGDTVEKGALLARLDTSGLDAQLAQNTAQIARADAAIAQARSGIAQAEAQYAQAQAELARAQPLAEKGYTSQSVLDQREAAARTAKAQLASARDGLQVAQAEKQAAEAQRKELQWRRDNAEIRAPAAGRISQRNAQIGALASAAGAPMFRIIAGGDVELEAQVPEGDLAKLKTGQAAAITTAGGLSAEGQVRLIEPQIDPATRLGKARIFLGAKTQISPGAFARGDVVVARSTGVAVPQSAVMYDGSRPYLYVAENNQVARRDVTLGLRSEGLVEVRSGVRPGDAVIAKSGTFLAPGDRIAARQDDIKLSGAQ